MFYLLAAYIHASANYCQGLYIIVAPDINRRTIQGNSWIPPKTLPYESRGRAIEQHKVE